MAKCKWEMAQKSPLDFWRMMMKIVGLRQIVKISVADILLLKVSYEAEAHTN